MLRLSVVAFLNQLYYYILRSEQPTVAAARDERV